MFSRKHRLAKTKDVQMAFARGRSFFNPFLQVRHLAKTGAVPRFTIVTSTKVSKKAVVRNRVKRLLREFIKRNLYNFAGGDYAVVVKPKSVLIKESDLLQAFTDLLKRSKLI